MRLFLLCWWLFGSLAAHAEPALHTETANITIHTKAANIVIHAELANTPEARSLGLMHRRELPDRYGMLFAYPSASNIYMWMKHTYVPLDMLFIDEHWVIVHMKQNAQPHDLTPVSSRYMVKYVLEVPASTAETYGISLGDRLTVE